MERRMVGATAARLPHGVPVRERQALRIRPVLELLAQLMGDDDPNVQKALAWALREWARVAPDAVSAFLEDQAAIARERSDGHRAWVVRDSLATVPAERAARIRARVEGVRKRPGAPSTSRAAEAAAGFGLTSLTPSAIAQQGERYARSHA
jgi:hypothetical protein